MPEPTEQPAPPLRTWRPMAAWTAGGLVALVLVWALAAQVVQLWQAHAILQQRPSLSVEESIRRLGGPERAIGTLNRYLCLPERLASQREWAVILVGNCGPKAVPTLIGALSERYPYVQLAAIRALAGLETEATVSVPALIRTLRSCCKT